MHNQRDSIIMEECSISFALGSAVGLEIYRFYRHESG